MDGRVLLGAAGLRVEGLISGAQGIRSGLSSGSDSIQRTPLNYFHAKVVKDLAFNGTEAAMFPSCN